ncbi:unnamed protein product [Linum trigynum]|uniref:Ubiquitin-like protease family profile domain-containing protein n=1 Tax=Linum trigynum TaxID=586398 RepID=A0AAV2F7S7_9ROSI
MKVRHPWFRLTRGEFKVLVPEIPLSTQVITMCVDLLTVPELENEKLVNWFLPPAFAVACATGDRVFAYPKKRIKIVYCSRDFNDGEKIFVPVLLEAIEIWESLPNCVDPIQRGEKVSLIAKELDSIFFEAVMRRFEAKMFCTFTIVEVVNAPRQENGFDCRLFVLKLMTCGGHLDECARGLKKKFDSEEERLGLAMYLLNNMENTERDALHQKVLMEGVTSHFG